MSWRFSDRVVEEQVRTLHKDNASALIVKFFLVGHRIPVMKHWPYCPGIVRCDFFRAMIWNKITAELQYHHFHSTMLKQILPIFVCCCFVLCEEHSTLETDNSELSDFLLNFFNSYLAQRSMSWLSDRSNWSDFWCATGVYFLSLLVHYFH